MKNILFVISLASILFIGCGTSTESDGKIITNLGSDDTLDTLSGDDIDLKEILTDKKWKKIDVDLDKFYPTAISTTEKSYLIDMLFENGKVTTYADCFKLTAKYKIDDKQLSFSQISYAPAIDLATCQQSKDADQAVYQLFDNTFKASKIEKDEIILYSDDFEAEIKLGR